MISLFSFRSTELLFLYLWDRNSLDHFTGSTEEAQVPFLQSLSGTFGFGLVSAKEVVDASPYSKVQVLRPNDPIHPNDLGNKMIFQLLKRYFQLDPNKSGPHPRAVDFGSLEQVLSWRCLVQPTCSRASRRVSVEANFRKCQRRFLRVNLRVTETTVRSSFSCLAAPLKSPSS